MFSGITISKYSKFSISDDLINDINNMIQGYDLSIFPKFSVDILFLNDLTQDEEKQHAFNLTVDDGSDPLNVKEIRYMDFSMLKAVIRKCVEVCIQQQSCQHEFVRDEHSTGNVYYNGQARCKHCDFKKADVFPVENHSQLCSMSMKNKDYPTIHDWRTADGKKISIQGGERGVVISRQSDNYITSFFEAFPDVHGYGTFIRGEGKNLKEAEESAWQKYQKRLNCENHEFSREVRGEHRSDGYAVCVHCGLTASALDPETLCVETQTPTTHMFCGQYLSYDAYFSKKPIDAITAMIEYEKSLQDSDVKSLFSHGPVDGEDIVSMTFDYMVNQWAYRYFNYHHKSYSKDKYLWSNYVNELVRLYEHIALKIPGLFQRGDDFVYPDVSISDMVKVCDQLMQQPFFEHHMNCFHQKKIGEVKETFYQAVNYFISLLK